MPDFVQTMKDWRRMCQHMEKMGGDRSCDICPLGGCNAIYEDDGNTDYADIGEKVAAWAAEHPEPAYPTWGDWFLTTCQVPLTSDLRHNDWETLLGSHIPADIAQKLGIQPKEG